MPETVNVPAMGKVNRNYVIAGGAAVAGIVAFAWWRAGQAPRTGPIEGEFAAEDLPSADAFAGARVPGGSTVVDESTPAPFTNAEWSQRLLEMLQAVGYEGQFVSETLGKYLSGQPLTSAEALLVRAAIGLLGNPPSGAIPIITVPTTPGTPTTPKPSPHKGNIVGAHGTRLTARIRLIDLAKRYAALPSNPDSVEGTKRWILQRNPFLVLRRRNRSDSILEKGWIIIVPTRAKAA